MAQILNVVQVTQAVRESKQRIPDEYRGKFTFFSDWDSWQYHYVHDEKVCPVCEGHGDMTVIIGSKIRLLFPYLEIVDADTIKANEHPNCRCTLSRLTERGGYS